MIRWFTTLLLMVSVHATAAIDTYEFKDDETRQRFQHLTEELRCPKCQNQNLADSNSPIAKDLRHEVYRMLGEGETDQQIADFMVARYGEFVLYKPRKDLSTYLLWYGPFALLLVGVVVVFVMTRRTSSGNKTDDKPELDESQRQQLNSLLDQDTDK
ncbi:cytochrome c-type biogenesis protein CcmH [Pontibacterium granulatum]|uniref:cytochrome c-type biogenesis protein n=1 Tax=Pontibacterium granulatum TaxID=2036029 RepID=UPI00249C9AC5|nr:cytochrome c-type biogenesis protein [Pontibacterium granulatum]MDI3322853.1 cytochrome c-type biogenesis protein CcmH [Pontibacterium granulatum]